MKKCRLICDFDGGENGYSCINQEVSGQEDDVMGEKEYSGPGVFELIL